MTIRHSDSNLARDWSTLGAEAYARAGHGGNQQLKALLVANPGGDRAERQLGRRPHPTFRATPKDIV